MEKEKQIEGKRNFKLKVTDGKKIKKSLEAKNNFKEFCNDFILSLYKNIKINCKSTVLPHYNNINSQEFYDAYLNEIENSPERRNEWLNISVEADIKDLLNALNYPNERPNIGGAENIPQNVFQPSFEIPKGRNEKILVEKLNKSCSEFIDKIKKDLQKLN